MAITAERKDIVGKALGRVASGIYILTTGSGENKTGMLASWVAQAGFEPPMVTVAVANEREILKTLESHPHFVLNILSDSNTHLMGRFGKFKPDQFDGLDVLGTAQGPVLKETVGYLACHVREVFEAGDHSILLAEVVDGEMLNDDLAPWTHVRKNGYNY